MKTPQPDIFAADEELGNRRIPDLTVFTSNGESYGAPRRTSIRVRGGEDERGLRQYALVENIEGSAEHPAPSFVDRILALRAPNCRDVLAKYGEKAFSIAAKAKALRAEAAQKADAADSAKSGAPASSGKPSGTQKSANTR